MTVDIRHPTPTAAWTPRTATSLAVLAAAAFTYVTAEILPVAALPAIASDLDVSAALVGTLLAGYALVAAVTTVPLVRWTSHWPRRRTLLVTLVCLAVSQIICATAPNFAVLAGGRLLCALTHGLMWSVIAPIAARLVPADHAGRATAAVYSGTALALVVGNPLTAAISELSGWRVAVLMIAAAATAVLLGARAVLPPLPSTAGAVCRTGRRVAGRRSHALSALTLVGVTGHFVSYTFIVVILREVIGLRGPQLAWLLAAFGIAGLLSMAATARAGDRDPRTAVLCGLTLLATAFGVLAWTAADGRAALIGVVAVLVWGATSTALPPMLQAAVIRSAPEDPDAASGRYVTAFQVGIMAGALAAGVLYEWAGPAGLLTASAVLIGAALGGVLAVRDLFGVPSAIAGSNAGNLLSDQHPSSASRPPADAADEPPREAVAGPCAVRDWFRALCNWR
ncbi:MFS transporter [Mycobacterium sp. CPCC 205372]|uniref:MFS transporter n=1 Tax=Mycobacterium hippophais TaxID=3016340 RepID=A0ABT4PTI0_9MYCO|nr:MFS transporter [Mycobacterium hippophais]MCZ8379835.1 MFS transporter [Mycobacterium hippophais]